MTAGWVHKDVGADSELSCEPGRDTGRASCRVPESRSTVSPLFHPLVHDANPELLQRLPDSVLERGPVDSAGR